MRRCWVAGSPGSDIYVHPVGTAHLLNPEKLLASAARLYGEMMDQLWGEFLPVPEEKLHILQDGDTVEIEHIPPSAPSEPSAMPATTLLIFWMVFVSAAISVG